MIELFCKRCEKTFERRGAKRGKKPYCIPCQQELEVLRKKKKVNEEVTN